ncbi:unnamed protein product [Symbiodinium sp. CCMP2592]|nr:unnamed protein product [Symbiodinium sp. CCMP2592]
MDGLLPRLFELSEVTAGALAVQNEVFILASCVVLVALAGSWFLSSSGTGKAASFAGAFVDAAEHSVDEFIEEDFLTMGMPKEPHLEGGFQPPTVLLQSNSTEPYDFDNDNCRGQFLALHRPTHDSKLSESGRYRYGEHFKGKKRLWELRFRFQLKRPLSQSDLFFGAELEEYVPLSAATKRAMDLSVSGMRLVVGDRLYHSPGDPENVEGERERPAITLPLWAFDQYIVTPEGEAPPELTDPDLPNMGHKRFGQLREYRRSLDALELVPGPTFTFCFWGVSRFCDVLQWQATGIPMFTPLDLNQYCGRPPLHFVLYTLTDKGEETRHLQSRKTYFFRCGFWSSLRRPGSDVVRHFAGKSLDVLRGTTKARKSQQSNAGTSAGVTLFGINLFQCCSDRPGS